MGPTLAYDDSATELFLSKERAEYVSRDFLEGRLSAVGLEMALKSVEALVKPDRGGDRVSWDGLLFVLLELYSEMKVKLQRLLGVPGLLLTLQEVQAALDKEPRWRDQRALVLSEISLDDNEKVRLDTLLSALLDQKVYKEGDLLAVS